MKGSNWVAIRTCKEVGEILGISLQAVQVAEKRALRKLRRHLAGTLAEMSSTPQETKRGHDE